MTCARNWKRSRTWSAPAFSVVWMMPENSSPDNNLNREISREESRGASNRESNSRVMLVRSRASALKWVPSNPVNRGNLGNPAREASRTTWPDTRAEKPHAGDDREAEAGVPGKAAERYSWADQGSL